MINPELEKAASGRFLEWAKFCKTLIAEDLVGHSLEFVEIYGEQKRSKIKQQISL